VALQRLQEVALGELDALDEGLERPVRRFARLRRHAVERPAHVVGDGQRVAGEVRHRVEARVGRFPLRAAAQVLYVGERPQELLAQVGPLRFEAHDRLGRLVARAHPGSLAGPRRSGVVGRSRLRAQRESLSIVRHDLGEAVRGNSGLISERSARKSS
jgi:hypothetical protein